MTEHVLPPLLTEAEREALLRGAHWTSERARFSAELADSIEKGLCKINESQLGDVTAYIASLRREANTHEGHAATLRALASRKPREGECANHEGLTPVDTAQFSMLGALSPGWNTYGAVPISAACIAEAQTLLAAIRRAGWGGPWSVVPCSDGGVQLEQHCYGKDIEISISMSTHTAPSASETKGASAAPSPADVPSAGVCRTCGLACDVSPNYCSNTFHAYPSIYAHRSADDGTGRVAASDKL